MKICLINPTNIKRDWGHSFPPLGLAYVAAVARAKGTKIVIHDRDLLFSERPDLVQIDKETRNVILNEKPDLLGLSATTATITDAFRVAKLAKSIRPSVRTIVGGVHGTALPRTTLEECSDLDVIVMGEGEETFGEIILGKEPTAIDGLAFRSSEGIKINELRKPIANIDSILPPARDLLDMKKYTARSKHLIRGMSLRGTSVFTTRGCPYNCSFCCGPMVFGRGIRFHSVRYVINEIESLIDDYRIEGIYFADDMFASHRQRAIDICGEMIKRGLNKKIVFAVQLKATVVDKMLLAKLKAAGCVQVEFGFESGSQRMLEKMNKRVKVADNLRAAELTRKTGLRMLGNFIIGMPQERKEDLAETIEFIEKVRPDVIGLYKLILLPGSQLFLEHSAKYKEANNWELSLVDDLTTNYTDIKTEEFVRLFNRYTRRIARMNASSYLAYHLKKNMLFALADLAKILSARIIRAMNSGLIWLRKKYREKNT